jgi:hypothetical protein
MRLRSFGKGARRAPHAAGPALWPPCPPACLLAPLLALHPASLLRAPPSTLPHPPKGFTVIEDRLASELVAEEKILAKDLQQFERLVEKARGRGGGGRRPREHAAACWLVSTTALGAREASRAAGLGLMSPP